MEVVRCSKADFEQILGEISDFWGSDLALHLHHPMFVYEFGNTAFVIKEGDKVLAYLFGFLSQTSPTGYVHLIGVRRSRQRARARPEAVRLFRRLRARARLSGAQGHHHLN